MEVEASTAAQQPVPLPDQTAAAEPAAPRRLENSLLDKSLDELIKVNRAERRNKLKKDSKKKKVGKAAKAQPQNSGVKKISLKELRAAKRPGSNVSKAVAASKQPSKANKIGGRSLSAASNESSSQRVPRNTPGLRQPWDKPATLPKAPVPSQPLKISIRNELAEKRTGGGNAHSMDWSSTSSAASRYEPRDRVEGRKEYRIGSRYSTQPMNIDYDLGRRY